MPQNTSAEKPVRLEGLFKQRFTPEGKVQRVSEGLQALYKEESIKLSPEEWKWVAETGDFEDQF